MARSSIRHRALLLAPPHTDTRANSRPQAVGACVGAWGMGSYAVCILLIIPFGYH